MGSTDRITAGALEDLGLPEIVQLIVTGRKTGCVAMTTKMGRGRIWFEDGQATHADTGTATGEAAFYQMMGWSAGRFSIRHDERCREKSIEHDATFLVLEAMRLRDEGGNLDAEVSWDVTSTGVFEQPTRLRQLLRLGFALSGTVLAVVALFSGLHTSVADSFLPGPPLLLEHGLPVAAGTGENVPNLLRAQPETHTSTPAVIPQPAEEPERAIDADSIGSAADVEASPTVGFSADDLFASIEELAATANLESGETPEPPQSANPRAATTVPEAYLHLRATSSVKEGTLVVVVDGREVYSTRLAAEGSGAKRFFKKIAGLPGQEFNRRLTVESGSREVIARLVRSDREAFESKVEVDLEPGQVEALQLVVGRPVGRPLVWKTVD